MVLDSNVPFHELPQLPPAVDLESYAVLKVSIRAARALAELKGAAKYIPHRSILVNAVALQEARSSSEIEGIITTTDALYRALSETAGANEDPHAKEVLRYSNALWLGYDRIKSNLPLCPRLFEELVRTIKDNQAGVRQATGTQLRGIQSNTVVYTPPEGEPGLRDKLANLDEYIHTDDGIDPLIKLAVIHYQFEAIHPFGDGNGRTGRIINILYLVEQGLLDIPVLNLSRYINENRLNYFKRLRAVTEQDAWEPWVLYVLQAIELTAKQTLEQIGAIRDLIEDYSKRMMGALSKIYSKELVEQLFDRPYYKIAFLTDAGIAKRQTASRYLQELADAGLLSVVKIGREYVYVNEEFIGLLRKPVDTIDMNG